MPPKRASRSRSRSQKRTARSPSPASAEARSSARIEVTHASPELDMIAEEKYFEDVPARFTPEKDKWRGDWEFCGPIGAAGIMIASHVLIYYFFICVDAFQGTIIYPGHPMLKGKAMHVVFGDYMKTHCSPTWRAFSVFWMFLGVEYLLALILPAFYVKGLPLPSQNGSRLLYKCNAVGAWYAILILAAVFHYFGIYRLNELRRDYGHYLTAAIITADVIAVLVYIIGLRQKLRMTGNFVYDFFMGSGLNFRLPGNIDVKLFAECRNSWVLLMLLTLSCAVEQYEELGYITMNMGFMVFAHLIYANAVQKGEECIITTWDLYYEKFGWMLAYWNTAGVPFLYCMQSLYIQTVLKDKEHPRWVINVMLAVLIPAYWIWDTINSQKNRFRMRRSGVPLELIRRGTFPQLPWSFIENPRTIRSDKGELFVDGWYRYARKFHYTVDLTQAFLWGASCGFGSFIPFFYFCFFFSHLVDRERRDEARCKAKYGKMWDKYVEVVPYKFIPFIY